MRNDKRNTKLTREKKHKIEIMQKTYLKNEASKKNKTKSGEEGKVK